jgi:hypothetical protein
MHEVRKKYANIISAYGQYFPLAALITYVIYDIRQKKPLYIMYFSLPMQVQGFCIGLADCDLIGIRIGLNENQKQITILHELSHLILKHIKLYSDQYGKMKLCEFLSSIDINTTTTDIFLRHDAIIGYSTERELAAESLATLLSPCIVDVGTIPNIIRDLYRIRG